MKILILILHIWNPDQSIVSENPSTGMVSYVVDSPEQASLIVQASGKGFNERSEGKLYELDLATNAFKEVKIPETK